jgi:hypothetical protein
MLLKPVKRKSANQHVKTVTKELAMGQRAVTPATPGLMAAVMMKEDGRLEIVRRSKKCVVIA